MPGAPLTPDVATGTAPDGPRDSGRARIGQLPLGALAAGCGILALASLLLPSALTYDPWAWVVWGREVAGLALNTSGGGPAWKPLPVLVTAAISAPGELASAWAPTIWLFIARAAGLLAVGLCYRLAARLGGVGAGVIAALLFASSTGYLGNLVLPGMSEPLLAALVLLAVDRHLDGRRTSALFALFGGALLRPETWPFLACYGLFLWVRQTRSRPLLVTLAAFLGLAWFGGEYWGSGDLLRSSHRAAVPTEGGPLLTAHPGQAVLVLAVHYVLPATVLGLLAAAAGAVTGRDVIARRTCPALLVLGLAWIGVVAAMTQAGASPGEQRYLIAGIALLAVAAGVGWQRLVTTGVSWVRSGGVGTRTAGAGILALAVAVVLGNADDLRLRAHEAAVQYEGRRVQAEATATFGDALRQAAGSSDIRACGPIVTGPYEVPLVAWTAHLELVQVGLEAQPTGTIVRARSAGGPAAPPQFRPVRLTGPANEHWEILRTCQP